MRLIFSKHGEYKNEYVNIEVTEKDVEDKKIFDVFEKNAMSYIKAGHAELAEEIKKDETDPEKMTVAELDNFAAAQDPVIDLSEAKNKTEKLEIIKAELEARKAD